MAKGPKNVRSLGIVNITAGRMLLYKHSDYMSPLVPKELQLAAVKNTTHA